MDYFYVVGLLFYEGDEMIENVLVSYETKIKELEKDLKQVREIGAEITARMVAESEGAKLINANKILRDGLIDIYKQKSNLNTIQKICSDKLYQAVEAMK